MINFQSDGRAGEPVSERVARFWRFFAAREAARSKKESGQPPPHSDDPVIAQWRFCNMYRDLDRGTVFFATHRGQNLSDTLWRSVTYRLINRRETFEAAERQGQGSLWLHPETLSKWLIWLSNRAESGEVIFTGRHIVRGLAPYEISTHWLKSNLPAVEDKLERLRETKPDLKLACEILREIPGVGPFFAWQVARDLVEASHLSEDDSWALAGPGARRGASLVDPEDSREVFRGDGATPARALAVMIYLRDSQELFAESLCLSRESWHRLPVNLADIEHALCEFARYQTLQADSSARAKCGRYP